MEFLESFYEIRGYKEVRKHFIHHATTRHLDVLLEKTVDDYEADKLQLRQSEHLEEVEVIRNNSINKFYKISDLLDYIYIFNSHSRDKFFMNKVKEIERYIERQDEELDDLVKAKKKELHKGLSPERIQLFLQFEADESHVGDQCQVCLEEVEVGRLMKQLDCEGRHSFCSVCIDQWFANHKTCPICRHNFA